VSARATLAAILAVAGLARFWAIDYCLPAPICRPDEEAVVNIVTQVFARDFNPDFFDWPTLFMYAVAAGVVVFFKIGLWLQWFRGEWHFLQTISAFPEPVFLIARISSAVAGVVSVWLAYRIGVRLFDRTTALIAAAFLALAFLHVRDSHFGVTDVTATCLTLAALLYLVRFERSRATRDFVVAAIWAGLATSTKYGAALVALPGVWIALVPGRAIERSWTDRLTRATGFVFVMGLAFAMTSPYCLIEFDRFISALGGVSSRLASPHGVMLGPGWLVYLGSSLHHGLGIPLLAAGLAGCVWLFRRNPRDAVIVLLFPIAYYATVGSGYTAFARYAVPLVPFLCLTAAVTVSEAARRMARFDGLSAWEARLAWPLAGLVVLPSLWSIVQFDRLLARPDSRIVAASWVTAHVPPGALIQETGGPWTHLYLKTGSQHQDSGYRQFAFKQGDEPDVLIVPTSPRLPADDQSTAAAALAARYRKVYEIDAYDPAADGIVYDWQDEFYLPLAGFSRVYRPGPTLTIYARPGLPIGGEPDERTRYGRLGTDGLGGAGRRR
jgi:hypothetical protein